MGFAVFFIPFIVWILGVALIIGKAAAAKNAQGERKNNFERRYNPQTKSWESRPISYTSAQNSSSSQSQYSSGDKSNGAPAYKGDAQSRFDEKNYDAGYDRRYEKDTGGIRYEQSRIKKLSHTFDGHEPWDKCIPKEKDPWDKDFRA